MIHFINPLVRLLERAMRRIPLVPLRLEMDRPVEGVELLRVQNWVTKLISRLGGGYDYAVLYFVDRTLLVDTGFSWARNALRKWVAENHIAQTLRIVVNTHYHEDHTGNNDLFAQMTNTVICAHPDSLSHIKYPKDLPCYRRFMFGPQIHSEVKEIGNTLETPHYTFEVLSTPGHCAGHICLYERKMKWLFSGDLFIAVELDSQLGDANGPLWIECLSSILSLDIEIFFDAHGTVIKGKDAIRRLLTQKRDFLQEIGRQVAQFSGKSRPVREITKEIFREQRTLKDLLSGDDGWLSLFTCGDFSRSNLVSSFLKNL